MGASVHNASGKWQRPLLWVLPDGGALRVIRAPAPRYV